MAHTLTSGSARPSHSRVVEREGEEIFAWEDDCSEDTRLGD